MKFRLVLSFVAAALAAAALALPAGADVGRPSDRGRSDVSAKDAFAKAKPAGKSWAIRPGTSDRNSSSWSRIGY
jgi:hypothetical protein